MSTLPRVTVTLGLGLISRIRWFRTFKYLKLSALLSPYLSIVRPHPIAADILQGPVTAKPTTSVAGPLTTSPNVAP